MSRVANKLIKAKVDSGFTPDPDFTKLLTTGGAGGTTLLNDLDDASQIDYFSASGFNYNTPAGGADMYTAVDDTNKVFMVTNRNADRLAIADWSDDTNIVATDTVTDSVRLDSITQVAVDPSKEFAYTTNYNGTTANRGHCRYDYSDPTNVTFQWFLQYFATTYGLTVNPTRELLYYFTSSSLRTFDISPTGTNVMVFKDNLNLSTSVAAYVQDTFLDIANDILYAVTSNDRIMAIDVSTDTAAVLLDSLVDNTNLDQAYAVSVDVAAGIAFVITRYGKISSIDISDPSNLALLDTYTGVGYSNDTARRGMAIDPGAKRVYTSYGTSYSPSGVKVIEYSDPSNLTLETTIDHSGSAYKGAKVHLYN
tara:strand:+ start:231 stop:1328 length:1098 start_codon:yes stop_codon:yes gene_type:complete